MFRTTATRHTKASKTKGGSHDLHEMATVDTFHIGSAGREFTLDPILKSGSFRQIVEAFPVTWA